MHGSAFGCGDHESTQPAGSGIVGMAFEHAGFLKDLLGAPAKSAEMHGQRDCRQPARRRRAAAHPQRNSVHHANGEGRNGPVILPQKPLVGIENEIVLRAERSEAASRPVALMKNSGAVSASISR